MSEVQIPLFNWIPLTDMQEEGGLQQLNEFFRQIDDSLRFLQDNVGPGGAGAEALTDLTDVVIVSPALNQVLAYNGFEWVNATLVGGGGPIAINDLTDVLISGPRAEQVLKFNGISWVNVGPVNLSFSYNGSDQLTGVDGTGINVDFAYNLDGTLLSVDNQTDTLTFAYASGRLDAITVAPS